MSFNILVVRQPALSFALLNCLEKRYPLEVYIKGRKLIHNFFLLEKINGIFSERMTLCRRLRGKS